MRVEYKNMNILYLSEFLFPFYTGGSGRYSYDLLNGLSDDVRVKNVDVLCRSPKGKYGLKSGDVILFKNLKNVHINFINLFSYFRFLLKIGKYDIVISHHPYLSILFFLFSARKRNFYIFQGPLQEEYLAVNGGNRNFLYYFKYIVQLAAIFNVSKVFILSDYMKSIALKMPIIRPICVTGPIINSNYLGFKSQINNNSNASIINIICIRRLTRRTGVSELIDQLTRIRDTSISLNIIGTGELYNEIDIKCRFSKNINLCGYIEDIDIPNFYNQSSISILPTIDLEGFGLVILESYSFGVPIVVSRQSGGAYEFVRLIDERFCYDVGDDDSLLAAIKFASQYDDRISFRYIAYKYTEDIFAEKLLNVCLNK